MLLWLALAVNMSEATNNQTAGNSSHATAFSQNIDFAALNERALQYPEEVLTDLLKLDIKQAGKEFQFLNWLRKDYEFGSASINSETGKWADFAVPDFAGGDFVSLVAKRMQCSQLAAAKLLAKFVDKLEGGDAAESPPAAASKSNRVSGSDFPLTVTTKQSRMPLAVCFDIDGQASPELESPAYVGDALIELRPSLPEWGRPKSVYCYRDRRSLPVAAVCRYEHDGKKTFRSHQLVRDPASKRLSWVSGAHERLRPLFNRDQIEKRPDAVVLFCEGEKAALAAQQLIPGVVVTTTMNGAMSPHKSDFRCLKGRRVIVAPDCDDPGEAYKDSVIKLARAAGAEIVGVVRLKKECFGHVVDGVQQDVPKGYDFADALAAGWTTERIQDAWPQMHEPYQAPPVKAKAAGKSAGPPGQEDEPVAGGSGRPPNGKKQPMAVAAEECVASLYGGRLIHDGSGFRSYVEGYWPQLNKDVDVENRVLKFQGTSATTSSVNSMVSFLAMRQACRPEEFEGPKLKICVKNGALDPITGVLHPHSPDDFLSNRLNVDWFSDAKCTLFLTFLDDIFRDDADRVQKIAFLREFFGYCLVPDTSMQKFLWLIGSGGNGKSVLLAILQALVGRENVSHAQLDRIQDKNVRAELKGKLLNISSEMSAQSTVSDGYLKQIVSGDTIEAERKFEPSFSFKPYSRLVGATNELPRLLDNSDGFFRRAIILTFNRRFTEQEQDRNLETRLMQELPGILAWAVAGLQLLKTRGGFEIPPSSTQVLARYRLSSNPVQQFAEEFLSHSAREADWVSPMGLYAAYRDWNSQAGYKQVSVATFKDRLEALGFRSGRTKSSRFWQVAYSGSFYLERAISANPPAANVSPMATRYVV